MTLGDFIKNYREEHSMSYEEFGKRCGFSKSYVYALEKNEHPKTKGPIQPSLSILSFISTGTGVPLDQLCNTLGISLSRTTSDFSTTPITSEEMELILEYRKADEASRDMVKRLLAYADALKK